MTKGCVAAKCSLELLLPLPTMGRHCQGTAGCILTLVRPCCRATKDPAGFNIIDVFAWGAIGHALGYAALAIISLNSAGINPGQPAAPLSMCMHVCLGYAACHPAACTCDFGLLLALDSMQSTGSISDFGPSACCSSQVLNVSRVLMEARDADVASCSCKGL